MISVDSSAYQAIPGAGSEGALDLTELPHEVIDLSSQGNPVDLSGTHVTQQARPELWAQELQFSYRNYLHGDD